MYQIIDNPVEHVKGYPDIVYNRLDTGTCYHANTPMEVVKVLEYARIYRTRIKLHFGDTSTGRDWNQEHDVIGYVGRSTGSIKIPILVYNNRSWGGGALLDHCILKISTSNGAWVLYQHPRYRPSIITVGPSSEPGYTHSVLIDGEVYANCHSEREAQRLQHHLTI